MKRVLLFMLLLVSTLGVSQAQTVDKNNGNLPEITFEKETHDFGTFKQGGNGTYEFKFKNTGKQPLIITGAVGSCGCTVPEWPKEPIKPGASGVIKVTYDTQRIGAFAKTVTLTSNAKTATKTLNIKGMIEEKPKEFTTPFKNMERSGAPVENPENK